MLPWNEEEEEPAETQLLGGASHSIPTHYPCTKTLLTHAEEIRLCSRAQAGDEAARQAMMEANLRLVMSMARRYRGCSMGYEDLVQEGILGLLEAIGKFDVTRGNRFSTYATWWIRQAIVRALETKDRIVRVPAHGRSAERQARTATKELEVELGRAPTVVEVAERSGLSATVVQALIYFATEPTSLDALMGDNEDTLFAEMIPDPAAIDPEDNSVHQAVYLELVGAFEVLSPKERYVIERRFGFDNGSVWTLQELAQELHMSREGVRHVECRSLKRLRQALASSSVFHFREGYE